MRMLLTYIRQCFCLHEFEIVHFEIVHEYLQIWDWGGGETEKIPMIVKRCTKCRYAKKTKSFNRGGVR